MSDYNKNSFFTCINNTDGIRRYFIKINGQMIEVNKSVYLICHNSYQKQLRDMRRDINNELISYDMQLNDSMTLLDTISSAYNQSSIESSDNYYINEIIQNLNESDRNLMLDLFFYEKSEKEIANELGISQQAVNKRKKKILSEIKKKF